MSDVVHRLARNTALAASRRLSEFRLRGVSELGSRSRVHGRPFIDNLGVIRIGDDFVLSSRPAHSHLVTGTRGVITIGNSVTIASGAAIASEVGIWPGQTTQITNKPYCSA